MRRRLYTNRSPLLQDWQAPPAFQTLLTNMLLADTAPENVVVGETLPLPTDLCSATKGSRVEVAKDLERHLSREDGEGVDAD